MNDFKKAAVLAATLTAAAAGTGCTTVVKETLGDEVNSKIGEVKDNLINKADDATGGKISGARDAARGAVSGILDKAVNATGEAKPTVGFSEAVKEEQSTLIGEGCLAEGADDGFDGPGTQAARDRKAAGECTLKR